LLQEILHQQLHRKEIMVGWGVGAAFLPLVLEEVVVDLEEQVLQQRVVVWVDLDLKFLQHF
jgi:hypothetical protein